MKPVIAVVVLAVAALAAPMALAQEPTVSPLTLQPLGAIPPPSGRPFSLFGEPTGDASTLPGYFASAPLRLSLQSDIFPMAGAFDQCATRETAAGNSTGGIPIQRYTLLRLTPNLVLHGFSTAGCPIDSGIGGGITYSARVSPTLWLVASAGAYGVPAHYPFAAQTRGDFRIDLIKTLDQGHSLSVGIGRRGVSFGGVF